MQRALLTLLLVLSASFLFPVTCRAAGGEEAAITGVGSAFFKQYLASKDPYAYLLKSPLMTPAAKSAFRVIQKKADKDGGLDSDPVTKGQDHPKSYQIVSVGLQSNKATAVAEAKGFPSIFMRFAKEKDGWKIDSVGEINAGAKH